MIAAISLFVIIFLSVLITRVATIALSHTGLSRESARFQARSALTGSGFTTSESEKVVTHPVRRKVILMLMLVGNAGIVTAVSSLILTFVMPGSTESLIYSFMVLVAGIAAVWWLAQSKIVDRYLSRLIDIALQRYTSLDLRDYAAILHLSGDFQISELPVPKKNWMVSKTLSEVKLSHEGILVLGIQRKDGSYMGTPDGSTKIMSGDVITLYGTAEAIKALNERRKGHTGDREHNEAVSEHQKVKQKERKEDTASL